MISKADNSHSRPLRNEAVARGFGSPQLSIYEYRTAWREFRVNDC